MRFIPVPFLLAALLFGTTVHAEKPSCAEIEEKSKPLQIFIPRKESGSVVIGRGRAYVYSAPNSTCKDPSAYLVQGDKVDSYAKYDGYTLILFINLRTGKEINGWVKSNRLKKTGVGISPN